MKKKLSLKSRALTSVLLTIGLSLGTVGIANAAGPVAIQGTLNKSGALVRYNTVRTHQFNGPITLNVVNMPSGYLRLGLRNMKVAGGPQFTSTIQWNRNGTQQWSNIRKGTQFAFQGRMKAGGSDNYWIGHLWW